MFGFSFRPRKSNTAQTAKERLQILLAHERVDCSNSDLLPILQRDGLWRHPNAVAAPPASVPFVSRPAAVSAQ